MSWGENGYIRIGRDYSLSDCRVTKWVVYPTVVYQDMGQEDQDDVHAEKDDGEFEVLWLKPQYFKRKHIGTVSRYSVLRNCISQYCEYLSIYYC